jgi:hypothetical protein
MNCSWQPFNLRCQPPDFPRDRPNCPRHAGCLQCELLDLMFVPLDFPCHHPNLTCKQNYLACKSNYLACKSNYLACKSNYLACKSNYLECKSNYLECKSNYLECKSNYLECKSNYLECKSNYLECKSNYLACRPCYLQCKTLNLVCKSHYLACKTLNFPCKSRFLAKPPASLEFFKRWVDKNCVLQPSAANQKDSIISGYPVGTNAVPKSFCDGRLGRLAFEFFVARRARRRRSP